MKKRDMYKVKHLFNKILTDFRNDGHWARNEEAPCRAILIRDSVEKGIEICDKYVMKLEPLSKRDK